MDDLPSRKPDRFKSEAETARLRRRPMGVSWRRLAGGEKSSVIEAEKRPGKGPA